LPELQVAFSKKRIAGSVPLAYQPEKGHIPGKRPHTCPEQHFYEPIKILENAPVAETTGNAARSKMLEDNLATA
jgi:hypothetical protein